MTLVNEFGQVAEIAHFDSVDASHERTVILLGRDNERIHDDAVAKDLHRYFLADLADVDWIEQRPRNASLKANPSIVGDLVAIHLKYYVVSANRVGSESGVDMIYDYPSLSRIHFIITSL